MKKKNAHISPFTKDSQSVIRENLQKLKRILTPKSNKDLIP